MEFTITLLNFVYAIFGAILTIVFMVIGYAVFDKITPFDTSRQLAEKNTAVGIVVGSIFVGLGVAVGLVIGLGLN
ncbi:MAG: DUF350 domain-containing protein [Deltaproteobacteria bacterium]|nr:DUF350 domain-containing protein [Deltaproteobacteria bacterium]MBW1921315.1 DUF350 domain-containing protein [Deltaproteobacteria bacterium]MBW1936761.1 DUF350 domain-containing protein [Deltaproteobacteria bacterium]MBW1979278.1 DUF350 domain-containing protein [Deltaproteobacteria bacterium]MBW2046828.1 DUF350 domain-containing protein [Deltaproteobacteria bacterium]